MLHDKCFPKFLWSEDNKTIVYIQNQSAHVLLDNMTPEEAFTRKKLGIDHLWSFGCLVYIHIPKEKRKKLDPSGMKGTFIGYSNSSKAYGIYTKEGHQIEVSWYVIPDETITFRKSKDLPRDSDDE